MVNEPTSEVISLLRALSTAAQITVRLHESMRVLQEDNTKLNARVKELELQITVLKSGL